MSVIRPLISHDALRKHRPGSLFKYLRAQDNEDGKEESEFLPPRFSPSPAELAEIVTALRDHALPQYLRDMADNHRYSQVFRAWLRVMLKEPAAWQGAIAPLFQVRVSVTRTKQAHELGLEPHGHADKLHHLDETGRFGSKIARSRHGYQ